METLLLSLAVFWGLPLTGAAISALVSTLAPPSGRCGPEGDAPGP